MNPEFAKEAVQLAQKREPTTYGKLLSAFGKNPAAEFNYSDWGSIVNSLAEAGLGLAPNIMLFHETPSSDSPMFLYQSTVNHLAPTKDEILVFHMGLPILCVGFFILSAADWDAQSIEGTILKILKRMERPEKKFSDSDFAGFRSNIDYLVRKPVKEEYLRLMCTNKPNRTIDMMQAAAVMFIRELDKHDPKTESIAIKTVEVLDLEEFMKKFDEFSKTGAV